jgi:N-acetylglucosamine kinase-like BadF-type ATPase
MSKYFLGVDAGGTKTHALIVNDKGEAVGFGRGGRGNWEGIGLDGLTKALQTAVAQALKMAGISAKQISGAGMGLAGYDWPSQREMILGAIRPVGLDCPLEIVNDATLGIFAGTSAGWGISVVSGTGCNCRGRGKDLRSEGRVAGGGSRWSGEYAGGGDIIARAMRAVTFEWNKRGPATALSPVFLEMTGAKNLDELVEGVYIGRYKFEAAYVLKIFEVAAQGDPEALAVIRWAGDELGQMACGVICQLGLENEPVEVVLIGSLYNSHPLMTESLEETVRAVAPAARFIRFEAPPVIGAALLGMEQVLGAEAYRLRDTVIETTNKVIVS